MDEAAAITLIEGHSSQLTKMPGGSFADVLVDMLNLVFVPIKLEKNDIMFKRHISFTEASTILPPPLMVMDQCGSLEYFATVNSIKLMNMFKLVSSSLAGGILQTKFSDDLEHDDKGEIITDKPYLQMLLSKFVDMPSVVYKEIHVEYRTTKNVFRDSLDVLIGSEANGKRPFIYVNNSKVSVYLGALCESKSSVQKLMKTSKKVAMLRDTKDLKALNQPMLEMLTFSQKTTFPSSKVPLLLIYGNRFMFRPFLYFRKYDVMLTTPHVIQHRVNQNKIYTLGLMLLYTLFQCHHTDVILFNNNILKTKDKTGFKETLKKSGESYEESSVTLVDPKPQVPHINVSPLLCTDIQLPSYGGGESSTESSNASASSTPRPESPKTSSKRPLEEDSGTHRKKRKKGGEIVATCL